MTQRQHTEIRRLHDKHLMASTIMDPKKDEDMVSEPLKSHRRPLRVHVARNPLVIVVVMLLFTVSLCVLLQSRSTNGHQGSGKRTSNLDSGSFESAHSRGKPISHLWGQYCPYYAVDSDVSMAVPPECTTNFAQMLSRHGARYPTSSRSTFYGNLIVRIRKSVRDFRGRYAFLKDYHYDLGADDLIEYGKQEMIDSGKHFYSRYAHLTGNPPIFVRASGQDRVVESAQLFVQGFNAASASEGIAAQRRRPKWTGPYRAADPKDIVIIPEGPEYNNTLDHSQCAAFEAVAVREATASVPHDFLSEFVPPIRSRLNNDLQGADLSDFDVISLMDLCPFTTLAQSNRRVEISPFCGLFTSDEWASYNHYKTLEKYYRFGPGADLGPTQGVGWVNELIARLTASPVQDHTNVNHTLDDDPETFPLDRTLYADFSHDNDMTSIFSALGLWNSTTGLDGFEAGEVVSFAARAWIERMTCGRRQEEFIRVMINHRVMPLPQCGSDEHGRCAQSAFLDSLAFARQGGKWDECSG